MGSLHSHIVNPDGTPVVFEESAFDPMFGFEKTGRKIREPTATTQEFASVLAPLDQRDYCGRTLMELKRCRYLNYPLVGRCDHEKHIHYQCEYEDYVIRMKEYERERRLMERAKRVGPERAGYAVKPSQA